MSFPVSGPFRHKYSGNVYEEKMLPRKYSWDTIQNAFVLVTHQCLNVAKMARRPALLEITQQESPALQFLKDAFRIIPRRRLFDRLDTFRAKTIDHVLRATGKGREDEVQFEFPVDSEPLKPAQQSIQSLLHVLVKLVVFPVAGKDPACCQGRRQGLASSSRSLSALSWKRMWHENLHDCGTSSKPRMLPPRFFPALTAV